MSRITRIMALFALLGSLTLPQVGWAQGLEAPQQIVRAVTFQGIEHVSAAVRAQLEESTKPLIGQRYDKKATDTALEAILDLGWFFRGEYRTEPIEGGVRIVFVMVENPVITEVRFNGNTKLTSATLLTVIKSKPGEVLNRDQVTQDAVAIKQAYARDGYTLVEVTDINITPEGRLEFQIFEPILSEIRIEGRRKTRDIVIRRQLKVRAGDVYNENAIRQTLQNLERLQIFQEVTAVPEPGLTPGTLILVINIKERRTGTAALGVGQSSTQGIIGFVDVADTNLFGSGQRLSMRVQVGAENSYEFAYANPWIDPKPTSFSVNLYNRSILREAVLPTQTVDYDEKRTGGNVSFGRPLSTYTQGFVTLRADKVRGTNFPSTLDPALKTKLERQFGPSDVRSITVSSVRDTRLDLLYPTNGSFGSLATEFAGFGGERFMKFTGDARRYWAVHQPTRTVKGSVGPTAETRKPLPWVIASRLMAGTTSGTPPFLDQFLVGGADTLRGYSQDRFPGKAMVLWNNELRIPLTDTLQIVGFVDAGDAWGGEFANEFGDAKFKLHYGYGAGVRVVTPIGPLRLDYGLNEDGGHEFHFGVGTTY